MSQPLILAGVVGHPISHSLSPLIHTIWAHRASINGYYIPIEIKPSYEAFSSAMNSLRTVGFRGVNVTLPHKENALRYADIKTDRAQKAGAANMLTFNEQTVTADNSDSVGFAEALKQQSQIHKKMSVLVLGAGGAARGVLLAIKSLGLEDITVTNRTVEKARTLANEFNLRYEPWETRNSLVSSNNIIVNTTSLGMEGQPSLLLDLHSIMEKSIVADIVYTPLETPLLKEAKSRGAYAVDGLAMLMNQAAPGFRTWFGGEAEVDDNLRSQLLVELEQRSKQ